MCRGTPQVHHYSEAQRSAQRHACLTVVPGLEVVVPPQLRHLTLAVDALRLHNVAELLLRDEAWWRVGEVGGW